MSSTLKIVRNWFGALSALALYSCTGVPEGLEVVQNLEADRYLGKWYEIVRLDHSFEENLQSVTADYSARDDGGIDVINRGYNTVEAAYQEARGKAYFMGDRSEGQLKVSFFGPFYGGYNIIALDDDYQWSMVAGPDRDYFWILARTPALDPALLQQLIDEASAMGFATEKLIKVKHDVPTQ